MVEAASEFSSAAYSPYAVDWRFLPGPVLFYKDLVRNRLAAASNFAALHPRLSGLWTHTLGHRIGGAIKNAQKLFIHIPKTGGTSVSWVLYGRNMPHYTADFYAKVFADDLRHLPSFSIVRDPISRFISSYKMAVLGGTDIMAHNYYNLSQYEGLSSVNLFTDYVYDHYVRLGDLPPDLRHQSSFVCDANGKILVDHLFAWAPDGTLPAALGAWLGVDPLPHLNASAGLTPVMSPKSKARILEIYQSDVALFDHARMNAPLTIIRGDRLAA